MMMKHIAPTKEDAVSAALEKRLWYAVDQFRANYGLKTQQYSGSRWPLWFWRRSAHKNQFLYQQGGGFSSD